MQSQIRLIHLLLVTCVLSITPIVSSTFSVSAIAQTVSSRKVEADRLLKQGNEQIDKNQAQEALKTLQQALAIYQAVNDRLGEGKTFKSIGNAYRSLKDYEKALAQQQQALAIALEIKDQDLEARALNNIGLAYQDLNNPTKVIEFFQKSLTVSQNSQNRKMIMIGSRNLGQWYNSQRDYNKAIEILQQGLEIAKATQDRQEEGYSYFNLGTSLYNLEKYPDAINYFRQSAVIAKERKDDREETVTLKALGATYQAAIDYEKAIAVYQQALVIVQGSLKDKELEVELLRNIAVCHSFLLKQPRTSLQLTQAMEFAEKLIQANQQQAQPKPENEMAGLELTAQAQTRLALYYAEQGEYELEQKYNLSVIETSQKGIRFIESQKKTEISELFKGEFYTFIGSSYNLLGESEKATEAFEKSLPLLQERNKTNYANAKLSLFILQAAKASTLEELNQILAAIEEFTPLAEKLFDKNSVWLLAGGNFHAYAKQIEIYLSLNEFKKAEQVAQKIVDLGKHYDRKDFTLSGLASLQQIYLLQGQLKKASEIQNLAIEIQSKSEPQSENDKAFAIVQAIGLAENYRNFGEVSQSIKVEEEALKKMREIVLAKIDPSIRGNLVKGQALILHGLSLSYAALGDRAKSLQFQQEYIDFGLKSGVPELKFEGLLSKAQLAISEQNLSQSADLTQQAIALLPLLHDREEQGSTERAVTALTQLSQIFVLQENYKAALEKAQQAYNQAEKSNNPDSLITALQALAYIYGSKGDVAKSFSFAPQLIAANQKNPNAYRRSITLLGLGNSFYGWGDYQSSRAFFDRALEDSKQVRVKSWELLLKQSLAEIAWAEGNTSKALELLREDVSASSSDFAYFELARQRILAIIYGETGKNAEAMLAANKALALAQKLRNSEVEKGMLSVIGSLHRKTGNNQAAIESFQTALSIRSSTVVKFEERSNVGIYMGLAQVYAAQKQTATAIAFYKKAVNGTEETRQLIKTADLKLQRSYLDATVDFGRVKRSDIYRQLADLLLSQGQVLEAQQVLELLKIQEIREFDRATRAKISATGELLGLDPTERTIVEKYGSYINFIQQVRSCQEKTTPCPEIANLAALREQAKAEYDHYIQDLNADSEKLKNKDKENFLDPRNSLSAKAAKLLEKRTDRAVIYSLVTDKSIWFVIATQDAPLRTFEVQNVSRKELSKAVGEFRGAMEKCQQSRYVCTTADTEAIKQISQKLHRWLFPPELQKELPPDKIKHLMFSLDRNIRYIPMSALFDGKNYLIEKYAISTITTADRPENELFSQTAQATSVLAMGASQFPDGLPPLPNVEIELKAIVRTNNQDRLGIYPGLEFLNQNFSKNNLQNSLPGRNILHLASHGVFSLRSPYDSYISLGDRNKLSIPDIRAISNLNGIDLVVLSACQTALGGREDEEGIEIMGSAFLQNQAKSVMASLWNVDDISTSLLMQQVYQNLAKNTPQSPITRAEALRQAQLQFIKGKTTIADGDRLRARASLHPKAVNFTPNSTPDFRHPYYWSPFVLMGSGF